MRPQKPGIFSCITVGVREGDEGLRRALITFIGDVANWDVANHPRWISVARKLVKAAHGDEPPFVVDPFAGGGSIPLEALRLGCDTFASDLNPVACLILKVLLEEIPRHGSELASDLRRVGAEVKKAAEKELKELYPTDPDGAQPIAYLWARTVQCEAPNCGAELPLMRSLWLSKKFNRRRALRPKILRSNDGAPRVEFEIFEPTQEAEVRGGTVTRARATCLCCGTVLMPERVRIQLAAQRGGADVIFDGRGQRVGGARLLVVVTLKPGEPGRHYRLPVEQDYATTYKAMQRMGEVAKARLPGGVNPVPDEPTPAGGGSGAGRAFSVQKYGMITFGDLFTARQKLALMTLLQLCRCKLGSSDALALLGLMLDGVVDRNASLATWRPQRDQEKVEHVFARQALPMTWDFAEAMPLSDSTGSFVDRLEVVEKGIVVWASIPLRSSQIGLCDAVDVPIPDESASLWFTDPPYYDAIPYADLSDFFFVWLKRTLPSHPLLHDPFDAENALTPKIGEIVQDETKQVNGRPKDRTFFEERMAEAFGEGRRVLTDDGVGCVVFAHKTTEGWEALLSGMIKGGWVITGSWPITTEMGTRLRARESAALATSVHLVCRPRPENAPIGDWGEVLRELPNRVGDWIERLQAEGVRGADLVFACIGPALEIFSRYTKVETAEGREILLPEFLEKIWEVVGRTALGQILGTNEATARNSAAGALEEDARLTALFLWTLQSTDIEVPSNGGDETEEDVAEGAEDADDEDTTSQCKQKGFSLIFDVVRRFAQPLGIHLDRWEGRIIETKKGVVRLLAVTERAQQLFGKEGAQAVADHLERSPRAAVQLRLFSEGIEGTVPATKGGRGRRKGRGGVVSDEAFTAEREATTLDRVHMAMLFQASGRTNALRALLGAEQERGPDFLRLANALSFPYPKASEEKRLLDAMLLATPK
jgi:putative DNA methylase